MHTLLFTDVVDSTRLVERVGDAAAAALWAEHDHRARLLLARYRGREIDRSDGFFLLFDRAVDGARFAIAYHQVLAALALSARVGIHVATVTLRQNPPQAVAQGAKPVEVEGLAKPFAARIMSLAGGGQTLLSASAHAALGALLPAQAALQSHGHYRLQGIEAPIEIFELGVAGCTFGPPPDTDKAYRVVPVGNLWQPRRQIRHNIPPERDTFIGRGTELRALARRLEGGARLVTVLGPGGTGKTRFVRRYALSWLGDWPGGVYFCDLSEARSLDGLQFAVALALGVPLGKDDSAVQLGHAIAGRGRCLVILDNFEQVVEHAPATLGRWLDRSAQAAFVVTSRERLQLQGEDIFHIGPLALDSEAIELFAIRARAQQPGFELGDANRAAVAEVVRLLDGLPLAVELAAARARIFSAHQLVERMKDRFRLLAGARGAGARQATLRAAIDWSWDLLAPWEQAALAQCSVFEGGFTLEAAEAVLDLKPWPQAPPAMDAVHALVDKSLLRTWMPAQQGRYAIDEPYFGMYLSIHEYTALKLDAGGVLSRLAAEQAHGQYFAGFGSDAMVDALYARGGEKRWKSLALEVENLFCACRRAIDRGEGACAVAAYRALWEVLTLRGPFAPVAALGTQLLALAKVDMADRAAAALVCGLASRRCGRMKEAMEFLAQSLTLARAAGHQGREGAALSALGVVHFDQGQMRDAQRHYEAALALHRETGNRCAEGNVLGNLGALENDLGHMEPALACYTQAIAIQREIGSRRDEGATLGNLAGLYIEWGRADEARQFYEQALTIHRDVGNLRSEGIVLGNLGITYNDVGRMGEALNCYDRALAIHRAVGNRSFEGLVLANQGNLKLDQGRIGEALACYDDALAICRETGNRPVEGVVLGNRGALLLRQGRIEAALSGLQSSLLIAREVGNRRYEAIALGKLGLLHMLQGRMAEARGHADAALVIDREVGDRADEGFVQSLIAELLCHEGDFDGALEALRQGEALLRAVDDRHGLALLLCVRGRTDAAVGNLQRAHAALAEAESAAAALCTVPEAALWRDLARLREALG